MSYFRSWLPVHEWTDYKNWSHLFNLNIIFIASSQWPYIQPLYDLRFYTSSYFLYNIIHVLVGSHVTVFEICLNGSVLAIGLLFIFTYKQGEIKCCCFQHNHILIHIVLHIYNTVNACMMVSLTIYISMYHFDYIHTPHHHNIVNVNIL